jgi:hypothetical protein
MPRRHLLLDLSPWLCLDLECSLQETPFRNREDWVQHLAWHHSFAPAWESINCPLCVTPTPQGKVPILQHLGRHLEEISLATLPACPEPETASGVSDSGSVVESATSPEMAKDDANSIQTYHGLAEMLDHFPSDSIPDIFHYAHPET